MTFITKEQASILRNKFHYKVEPVKSLAVLNGIIKKAAYLGYEDCEVFVQSSKLDEFKQILRSNMFFIREGNFESLDSSVLLYIKWG